MRNAEQNEILGAFLSMLEVPTGDGGNKRAAGTKPLWKVDPGHAAAFWRHVDQWALYEDKRYDGESGAHHLVHAAWRALAIAYQEMVEDGLIPESPPHGLPDRSRVDGDAPASPITMSCTVNHGPQGCPGYPHTVDVPWEKSDRWMGTIVDG